MSSTPPEAGTAELPPDGGVAPPGPRNTAPAEASRPPREAPHPPHEAPPPPPEAHHPPREAPPPAAGLRKMGRVDEHRLALLAKLTEIGIPPVPEDRQAVRLLSALDASSVAAVLRWLSCAADLRSDHQYAVASPEVPPARAHPVPPPENPPSAPGDPEAEHRTPGPPDPGRRIDPRLLPW